MPLRIFHEDDALAELTFNRKECEGMSHVEFFHYPIGYLPYLQIMITPTSPQEYEVGNNMISFKVIDACTEQEVGTVEVSGWRTGFIADSEATYGVTFHTFKSGVVSFGAVPTPPAGLYYLTDSSPGNYYSDPFFWGDVSEMIHLKWRDKLGEVTGDFFWRDGMSAECYVNDIIQRPTYPILEETKEDQELDTHRVFQKWDKRHVIRFRGVESMCDAMSVLPTMEYVYVNNVRVYDTLVNITWEEDEPCIGVIEMSFSHKKFTKSF